MNTLQDFYTILYLFSAFIFLLILFVCRDWLKFLFLLPRVLWYNITHKTGRRLFGVRAYCGDVGQGKTISAVREALSISRRYPNVLIYSNMAVDWALPLESLNDLVSIFNSDRPSLIVWDEVGVNLNSRNWNVTPFDFISLLAQNRKGSGTRLIYTAQDYSLVDKQLRTLTNDIIICRTFFGRITCNYIAKKVNRKEGTCKRSFHFDVFDNYKFRKDYDTYETVKKVLLSYLDD